MKKWWVLVRQVFANGESDTFKMPVFAEDRESALLVCRKKAQAMLAHRSCTLYGGPAPISSSIECAIFEVEENASD